MIRPSIASLALIVICAARSIAQTVAPFPDVPRDHWAYQAVKDLKQKGILRGYPAAQKKQASLDAALVQAVSSGDLPAVKALLHQRASANARTEPPDRSDLLFNLYDRLSPSPAERKYPTVLMLAAAEGNIDIARLLISRGADVNASGVRLRSEDPDHHDDDRDTGILRLVAHVTALDLAGEECHLEMMRLLLQHGARVNDGDSTGWTPLLWAAGQGKDAAIQLLLDHHADINIQDREGHTALMIAVRAGCMPAIRLLLDRGCDVRIKDKKGETAISFTFGQQRETMVALLQQYGAKE